MKKTVEYLSCKKKNSKPISMVTAYDYPTALLAEEALIDSILVGDSLGTNVLGYQSEREVSMADMIHHLKAVSRAVKNSFLIADLPFGCADTFTAALDNSRKLIDHGADCVKIEGWSEKVPIVEKLCSEGINICSHVGYNPQIHDGKPRTFGKAASQALELLQTALKLQLAGAVLIVLEKIPTEVAQVISQALEIATIGIGSGNCCDGQVLVVHDLLGMSPRVFRHVKPYAHLRNDTLEGFKNYSKDVESRLFPSEENSWHLTHDELLKFKELAGEIRLQSR